MDVSNELKNMVEEHKAEMSVNVYNKVWKIINYMEADDKLTGELNAMINTMNKFQLKELMREIKKIKDNEIILC